ncbi:hypothetical protein N9772_05365 [Bacteroidia bacterium]|nr:hypothetical protein [Bacteroidia bacterium]
MNHRSTVIFLISLIFSQSCVTTKYQESEPIKVREKNKDELLLFKQESGAPENNKLSPFKQSSNARLNNSIELINNKQRKLDSTIFENDTPFNFKNDKLEQVYICQNGEEQLLQDKVTIVKSKFSIRFYNYGYDDKLRYHARLRVTEHKRNFKKNKIGSITNDFSNVPFSNGWGIASQSNGYKRLWFLENGFHYLYYKNDKDRTVKLIERADNLLKLDFEINNFTIGEGSLNGIEDIPTDQFYLAIYIDRNLNNTIDKGELFKCKLVFR